MKHKKIERVGLFKVRFFKYRDILLLHEICLLLYEILKLLSSTFLYKGAVSIVLHKVVLNLSLGINNSQV